MAMQLLKVQRRLYPDMPLPVDQIVTRCTLVHGSAMNRSM
jgi:hypothetical protein